MKVEQSEFHVESTMPGTSIAMGIDQDSLAHIMGIMTDLYEDRLAAIIREYSTNGNDAHIEAGFSGPLEITLPSQLAPFLRIRDFGVGLTQDDIAKVYSQYGASTKRNTNDQAGMLGLGCKSALTYTTQFTVVSVKEGRKVTVLVSRNADGGGSMLPVANEATDEASGTEIVVAIKPADHDRCRRECLRFFSYWTPGTVTVNGVEPERFSGLKLTDTLYLVKGTRQSTVVMGQVAYQATIDLGINGYAHPDFGLVAFVPIGSVRPVPSREGLMDTPNTQATLAQIAVDFHAAIDGAIQAEVDAAPSPADAVRRIIEWARYVPNAQRTASSYTYKGHTVPTVWPLPGSSADVAITKAENDPSARWDTEHVRPIMVNAMHRSRRRGAVDRFRDWPVAQWSKTVWVYNFDPQKFNASHHDKLRMYCAENQIGFDANGVGIQGIEHFVMLRGAKPTSYFIDDTRCVDWAEAKKTRLVPRAANGSPARLRGSYDTITETGYHSQIPADQLRSTNLFWMSGRMRANYYTDVFKLFHTTYTLVTLPGNRVAKFQRDFPHAKAAREACKALCDKWLASLTDAEKLAMTLADEGIGSDLRAIPDGVKDPALIAARAAANVDVQRALLIRKELGYVVPTDVPTVDFDNPLDRYPLYSSRKAYSHAEHLVLYMNAVHAAG